jgi:hypothetical protein
MDIIDLIVILSFTWVGASAIASMLGATMFYLMGKLFPENSKDPYSKQ